SLVYFTVYGWLLSGQKSVMDGTTFEFGKLFRKLVIYYAHVAIVIYWTIVLAHHGWHYYQRSRERELQASALATELVRTRLEARRLSPCRTEVRGGEPKGVNVSQAQAGWGPAGRGERANEQPMR